MRRASPPWPLFRCSRRSWGSSAGRSWCCSFGSVGSFGLWALRLSKRRAGCDAVADWPPLFWGTAGSVWLTPGPVGLARTRVVSVVGQGHSSLIGTASRGGRFASSAVQHARVSGGGGAGLGWRRGTAAGRPAAPVGRPRAFTARVELARACAARSIDHLIGPPVADVDAVADPPRIAAAAPLARPPESPPEVPQRFTNLLGVERGTGVCCRWPGAARPVATRTRPEPLRSVLPCRLGRRAAASTRRGRASRVRCMTLPSGSSSARSPSPAIGSEAGRDGGGGRPPRPRGPSGSCGSNPARARRPGPRSRRPRVNGLQRRVRQSRWTTPDCRSPGPPALRTHPRAAASQGPSTLRADAGAAKSPSGS